LEKIGSCSRSLSFAVTGACLPDIVSTFQRDSEKVLRSPVVFAFEGLFRQNLLYPGQKVNRDLWRESLIASDTAGCHMPQEKG